MISFEWFRTFVAVYQQGTTTAASEVLSMTQPGVSNHIAALETAIGARLFDRTARRMLPTEKGKEVYSWVIEPMEKLDIIENRLKTANTPVRPMVRIGSAAEYFHFTALEKIDRPDLRYRIRFDVSETLLSLLTQGELDVVISTQKTVRKEWQCDFLMQEVFVLISGRGFKGIDPALPPEMIETMLCEQPWVVYGSELPALRRYWKVNFGKRPSLDPVLILPNYLSIIKAVRLGWGIAVVPEYLCADALYQKKIIMPWKKQSKVTNRLYLVYPKSRRNIPSIAQTVAALKKTPVGGDKG